MISSPVFLAQDEQGSRFVRGLHGEGPRVFGLDPSSGLAVLSLSSPEQSRASRLAAEILLDDMQANLSSITQSELVEEAPGLLCLRESLANIEEYLHEEGLGEVSLAALQVDDQGRVSLALTGGMACHLRSDRVQRLTSSSPPLGGGEAAEPLLFELPCGPGYSLLLLPQDEETAIGAEYVQISLGRFHDAPEMLLRQLSVRAQRNGMESAPSLLFASAEAVESPGKGLLGRFMKR